jgi:hypothetical protein
MEDPQFVDDMKRRYSTLRKTTLSNEYLMHYIDSVNTVVNDAQVRHYTKWPILGKNVGAPESDYIPATFAGESAKFKNWINTRLSWLDIQLLVPDSYGIVESQAQKTYRIFPNPARDIITVETEMPVESISIFNFTGKLVQSVTSFKSTSSQVNVSGLSAGIYIVKLDLKGGEVISGKLIIE